MSDIFYIKIWSFDKMWAHTMFFFQNLNILLEMISFSNNMKKKDK